MAETIQTPNISTETPEHRAPQRPAVLTLSEPSARPVVDIYGKAYHLRSHQELSRKRYKVVMLALNESRRLQESIDNLPDDQAADAIDRQFSLLADATSECMFDLSREQIEKLDLPIAFQMKIVETFFKLGGNATPSS